MVSKFCCLWSDKHCRLIDIMFSVAFSPIGRWSPRSMLCLLRVYHRGGKQLHIWFEISLLAVLQIPHVLGALGFTERQQFYLDLQSSVIFDGERCVRVQIHLCTSALCSWFLKFLDNRLGPTVPKFHQCFATKAHSYVWRLSRARSIVARKTPCWITTIHFCMHG